MYLPEELSIKNYIKCKQTKIQNILFHMSFIERFYKPSLRLPLGIPGQILILSDELKKKNSIFLQLSLMIVA